MTKFPTPWKHAIVTLLLKKPGLDETMPSHYRPVSNFSFLSTDLEKSPCESWQLILWTTHSFWRFNLLITGEIQLSDAALLHVLSDIIDSIGIGHVAILVLLDSTATFDTVDHTNILQLLERSFDVLLKSVDLIASYLTERTKVSRDQRRFCTHKKNI